MCIHLFVKLIFEESYGVYSLCPVLFYSHKELTVSKETEILSPLPFKMKPNVMSQEPQNVNQFFDKSEENVVLQKTTNEGIENNCARVITTEEHIDKMYLDILRKKRSVARSLLPPDDKIHKVSVYNIN